MKNIFEGAKFGDKFKVRNGNQAIYIESYMSGDILTHYLVQEGLKNPTIQCYDDGQHCMNHKDEKEVLFPDYVQYDIIGKWEELIDEEKLDKLAKSYDIPICFDGCAYSDDEWDEIQDWVEDAYKSGYRKAKGE